MAPEKRGKQVDGLIDEIWSNIPGDFACWLSEDHGLIHWLLCFAADYCADMTVCVRCAVR